MVATKVVLRIMKKKAEAGEIPMEKRELVSLSLSDLKDSYRNTVLILAFTEIREEFKNERKDNWDQDKIGIIFGVFVGLTQVVQILYILYIKEWRKVKNKFSCTRKLWWIRIMLFLFYMLYLLWCICNFLSAMIYLLWFVCYALSVMLYLLRFICYGLSAMIYLLCFICFAFSALLFLLFKTFKL